MTTTRAAYYTTQEIAERMKTSERTVIRMCEALEMPGAFKFRGQWRISQTAFDAAERRALKSGVFS